MSDAVYPQSGTILRMGKEASKEHGKSRVGGEQMSEAEIDYNVMGSFPASDPPSWTLGVRPHKTNREEFEGEKPSPHDPSHQNEPKD
ncbi:MAG TPA: hypothetical protein VFZ71_09670 [Pyrinomonadaceae bacterium]